MDEPIVTLSRLWSTRRLSSPCRNSFRQSVGERPSFQVQLKQQAQHTLPTKIKFVSPFMTAEYPHISTPDTQGKFADNKYKTKGRMPLGDPQAQAFIKSIDDAYKAAHGSKAGLHKPYVIDEDANTVTFTFKTQYQPAVFDGRNKPIPSTVRVGGGSVVRLIGQFVDYEKGVSAQFNQVQVRELNGPGVSAFDEVDDGYSYDGSDEPVTSAEPVATNAASLDI